MRRLSVVEGDITRLDVDAIVNAANESLLGGGGVDGAIHRAAGAGLVAECRALPQVRPGVRCPTGEARITGGHALTARHVVHTAGPIWYGGTRDEPALLAACYRNSLALAAANDVRSIAFPAISCGAFGYPLELAVPLAVATVDAWLESNGADIAVVFCCFGRDLAVRYRQALADLGHATP